MGNPELGHLRDVRPLQRVYGLESELGVIGNLAITHNATLRVKKYVPGIEQVGQFLSNGARLYRDFGEHLEYATPECQTLAELIACDIGGQELLVKILQDPDHKGVTLNTRVLDSRNSTWGSHENYLTRRYVDPYNPGVHLPLASHLATRSVLTGAGYLVPPDSQDGGGVYRFRIAQKIGEHQVGKIANDTTTRAGTKPLVNLRDEPHADKEKYRRLHIISGDPTMSPWATAIRFGSMSLVLRLLEHGADLRNYILKDPVQAAIITARDAKFREPVELETGERIRPAELQRRFAELCLQFAAIVPVPPEEEIIAQEWYDAADDVLSNPHSLAYRADWATKWELMKNFSDQRYESKWEAKIKGIDIAWGELSVRGIGRLLRQHGKLEDPLDAVQHADYHKFLPPTGRAEVRGHAISVLVQGRVGGAGVNWNSIAIGERRMLLNDPLGRSEKQRNALESWIGQHTETRPQPQMRRARKTTPSNGL